jgi:hypothetical protein
MDRRANTMIGAGMVHLAAIVSGKEMRARGWRKGESLGIKSPFENVCFVLVLFYAGEGLSRWLCARVPATHPVLGAED